VQHTHEHTHSSVSSSRGRTLLALQVLVWPFSGGRPSLRYNLRREVLEAASFQRFAMFLLPLGLHSRPTTYGALPSLVRFGFQQRITGRQTPPE